MGRPRIQAISDTTRAGVERRGLTLTARPRRIPDWSGQLVCDDRGPVCWLGEMPKDEEAPRAVSYDVLSGGKAYRTGGTFKYVPTLRRFLGSREYQGLRRRFVGKGHYGNTSSRADGDVSAPMRASLAGEAMVWAQWPCGQSEKSGHGAGYRGLAPVDGGYGHDGCLRCPSQRIKPSRSRTAGSICLSASALRSGEASRGRVPVPLEQC